jgi:hypothetical protein
VPLYFIQCHINLFCYLVTQPEGMRNARIMDWGAKRMYNLPMGECGFGVTGHDYDHDDWHGG